MKPVPHAPARSSTWTAIIEDETLEEYLALDLQDILAALDLPDGTYSWLVGFLDCVGGEESQRLSDEVEATRDETGVVHGLAISDARLRRVVADISQTIDGTFVAVPEGWHSFENGAQVLSATSALQTGARIVIRAVDSSFFEVTTETEGDITALMNRFEKVALIDPAEYFPVETVKPSRWVGG